MVRDFGHKLRGLREARGLSQSALARATGLNVGFVNRLESGERRPTSRPMVAAFLTALDADPNESARLFAAAGFLPDDLEQVGVDDPSILLVSRLLNPDRVPPETRRAIRQVLEALGAIVPNNPASPPPAGAIQLSAGPTGGGGEQVGAAR